MFLETVGKAFVDSGIESRIIPDQTIIICIFELEPSCTDSSNNTRKHSIPSNENVEKCFIIYDVSNITSTFY